MVYMLNVLVIDDEPMICEITAEAIAEHFGAHVEYAVSAVEGARLLQVQAFNFALIDDILPDGSGIELAILAANENVPVLLITAHPDAHMKMVEFGFPSLAKPFRFNDLHARIDAVMRETPQNIRTVKVSAAKMLASKNALQD